MSIDYYKILGIDKNADDDAIKKAYRKMAMKHHPDQNKGDKKSEEKFKQVSEAYEILSDADKKAFYDRHGFYDNKNNPRSRPQNPHDIFSTFFGGNPFGQQGNPFGQQRTHFNQRMVQPDNKFVYSTTLKNIISGKDAYVNLKRHIACEECQGKGSIFTHNVCGTCGGSGVLQTQMNGNLNMVFQQTCGDCLGTGKAAEKCKKCDGKAYDQENIKIKLSIPIGIQPLSTPLKVKGKGNVVYVNDRKYEGDVYVVVDYPIEQDGVRLDSQGNIHAGINVPFNTIIACKKITVDILGCKKIKFKLESNTKTGQQYRIKGKGTTDNTHVFIKVFIDAPENDIDEDAREQLIKTLEEAYGKSPTTFTTTRPIN